MERIQDGAAAQAFLNEFVGRSYPAIELVVDKAGQARRAWTLRTSGSIARATDADLKKILSVARSLIPVIGTKSNEIAARLTIVDDNHAVLEVEFPLESGYDAMAANWGVLVEIDRMWRIEDLQGLPSDLWAPLCWSRSMRGVEGANGVRNADPDR